MNIAKVSKEFLDIDVEMSELLAKSDSLATYGVGRDAWDRYKELKDIRFQKAKALFTDNNPDDMSDYIHDVILADDLDISMPIGYKATIIASYYNSIMRWYTTIAVVETSKQNMYLIDVATCDKVEIGTVYNENSDNGK